MDEKTVRKLVRSEIGRMFRDSVIAVIMILVALLVLAGMMFVTGVATGDIKFNTKGLKLRHVDTPEQVTSSAMPPDPAQEVADEKVEESKETKVD